MAEGSRGHRIDPKKLNDTNFSGNNLGPSDIKKCSEESLVDKKVKLSFYKEQETSVLSDGMKLRGVVDNRPSISVAGSQISSQPESIDDTDDRKKRCFDRYDSSESSDSGVAVLSSTESSESDITEPSSPRSPESGTPSSPEPSLAPEEEGKGARERMPPWAAEAPRRLAVPPAPSRRAHRRITEFFNHKMKPQHGLKRDLLTTHSADDTKRKCLPKNGVTHDLEKYISYLSQNLNPKVFQDVGKHTTEANGAMETGRPKNFYNATSTASVNVVTDLGKPKETVKDKNHAFVNGFKDKKDSSLGKSSNCQTSSFLESKKHLTLKQLLDSSSSGTMNNINDKLKIPIPVFNESLAIRSAPLLSINQTKKLFPKPDTTKINGVVSSTTKLDSGMNGVTCGSNNLSLNSNATPKQNGIRERKTSQPAKRTNRKSSACIANSKNLTWSKANNLKQIQLQKQNCVDQVQKLQTSNNKINSDNINLMNPKMNNTNGLRQLPMPVNGNLNGLNVSAQNFQNCHQINIPQSCNGSVTSTNLTSFVAVPQNVMLTTLRIPQNGIPAQALNQTPNMAGFNRSNVNVTSSPTKLNGQFVFPLIQNLNGAVVQIPSLMAKMPNFVLPQSPQLTAQRQDLQNQQAATQFLINGTLLKLPNTITSPFNNVSNVNMNNVNMNNVTVNNISKPIVTPTSQPLSMLNKTVPGLNGIHSVSMAMQSKTNFTVNLSHPMLMPQPGFIVTSVPNINVKETWSSTCTSASSQTTCSNPIIHHQHPIVANLNNQSLHTSSIPLAPVKPPDNPIQGTDPPSSTVKESDLHDATNFKCDIPWLAKTVNNNIFLLDSNKEKSRPFAHVNNLSEKLENFAADKRAEEIPVAEQKVTNDASLKDSCDEIRKVEEVARREETLFSQITVLKDVSCSVQNSVIETNFCSAATESSESGISTDNAIYSPSDSQASKECDEDSTLSLSISVSSVEVTSCQKSPILKQPKTLRFPPKSLIKPESDKRTSSTDTATTVSLCLWENCKKEFDGDNDLLEHLQSAHVDSQTGKENYVCLWERCKVRGKPSCSRMWLERHALSHGGNKPFKCIVDGCERRFTTQILLERHVNHHFSSSSPNSSSKRSSDSAQKLIRRNGKKLRYRRTPWSARMFDFIDTGIMEGLAWRLSRGTRWRLGGSCPLREPPGKHTITLHAALTATRYNAQERRNEALLTYYPPRVIEDEWVPEKDVKRIKRVEISGLPVQTKVLLYEQFCESYRKSPSPPPQKKQQSKECTTPSRMLPARNCASSRLLNNLLSKKPDSMSICNAVNTPIFHKEEEKEKIEVSGAKKRKMGRRHGGNAFWPCGR